MAAGFQFFVSVTHRRAAKTSRVAGGAKQRRQLRDAKNHSPDFAFEPEQISAIHKAFEAVCAELQLSFGLGDRVTELVAQRIIELAMAGEREPAG